MEQETDQSSMISEFGKARVEAITDGIFAIAMTLLVLNLHVEPFKGQPTEAEVWAVVVRLVPDLLAFIASFITLGMFWISHNTVFRHTLRADRVVIWLNMYFLLGVSLIPFTTGLYAGDIDSRIANAVFGANLILVGLLTYVQWRYVCDRKYADPGMSTTHQKYISNTLLIAPGLAVTALLLSQFEPVWAEAVYLGMVPFFMLSVRKFIFPFHVGKD